MIWFVSRHAGAREWAARQGLRWDRAVPHLDPAQVADADAVYGTLPAHVAAHLCARGVRYWHLAADLPEALRGTEVSADALHAHAARFVRLEVMAVAR